MIIDFDQYFLNLATEMYDDIHWGVKSAEYIEKKYPDRSIEFKSKLLLKFSELSVDRHIEKSKKKLKC